MSDAPDNAESAGPVRVRVRFETVDEFVEKFNDKVTRSGVFIPTKKPALLGSRVRFEVLLKDGTQVCAADGKVAWLQGPGTDEPDKRQGMGLKFTRLEGRARELIYGILRRKSLEAGGGLPSRALEAPESDADEPTAPVDQDHRHDNEDRSSLG